MKRLLTTLSALALASTLALAQDKPAGPPPGAPGGPPPGGPGVEGKHQRPSPEEIFKKLDTDGDGFLSLEEFKAGPRWQNDQAKAEEVFKKLDTNGDGKLSLEEFKAGHPPREHGPGGPGGRGPGGPGGGGPGGPGGPGGGAPGGPGGPK
jgi:hypothetical protein